jgi:hypothetical protein
MGNLGTGERYGKVNVKYITPRILNLGTGGDEWSASRTARFISGVRTPPPGTHWIGGWVGPKFGLEAVAYRKNPTIAPVGN